MSENNSLFISYSIDENASVENMDGWVEDFIRYLTVYIQKINNHSPKIIPLKDSAKRPDSLGKDDGIVLIVGQNYLSKNLSPLDSPLLAETSRVYKVDLEPLKKGDQPKEISILNEFHFYEPAPGGDNFKTLTSSDKNQNYWLKIIDLAFEINRTIYGKKEVLNPEDRKVIYLAETSYDQILNHDEIKRELIRHGHTVIPSSPFSSDSTEMVGQVKKCLADADLSVHLIGEAYGEVPDGSKSSVVEIQNQLSTEYYALSIQSDAQSLHRLIWMPLYLKARSDQQKLYLDQLKDDITSTVGAEIIQTPLEILKTVIHARLQLFESESQLRKLKDIKKSEKKSVYLLFDKKDENEIESMIKDIESRNIEVIRPRFDSKQIDFLKSHRESLVRSDVVLLFANKNLNWVHSKLNDVIKAPGFGKQFPFEAKAIYIKDKTILNEKMTSFGNFTKLNENGKDTTNNISSFLDSISSS